ncbi:hypothetical protein [Nocardioides lacusdianchii]|uniref:hypothetical protein n=1 Tax=Nocardioides lacusdianchii TaxID=2783664 RepID=UPI001CCBF8EB|nr:hypothetical protein [Nocardioides lacusdianchii]
MDETVGTTGAGTTTDEAGRFRAFTGFGLALTALLGGGLYASAFQWLGMKLFNQADSDRLYFTGIAASPLVMALVALGLAAGALGSDDPLVRPVARATGVLGRLAVVGSALLLAVTLDTP